LFCSETSNIVRASIGATYASGHAAIAMDSLVGGDEVSDGERARRLRNGQTLLSARERERERERERGKGPKTKSKGTKTRHEDFTDTHIKLLPCETNYTKKKICSQNMRLYYLWEETMHERVTRRLLISDFGILFQDNRLIRIVKRQE